MPTLRLLYAGKPVAPSRYDIYYLRTYQDISCQNDPTAIAFSPENNQSKPQILEMNSG